MNTKQYQLQNRAPNPHVVENRYTVDECPHKSHGNTDQNHKYVVNDELGVFVADSKTAKEFGEGLVMFMLLDADIKFQL